MTQGSGQSVLNIGFHTLRLMQVTFLDSASHAEHLLTAPVWLLYVNPLDDEKHMQHTDLGTSTL